MVRISSPLANWFLGVVLCFLGATLPGDQPLRYSGESQDLGSIDLGTSDHLNLTEADPVPGTKYFYLRGIRLSGTVRATYRNGMTFLDGVPLHAVWPGPRRYVSPSEAIGEYFQLKKRMESPETVVSIYGPSGTMEAYGQYPSIKVLDEIRTVLETHTVPRHPQYVSRGKLVEILAAREMSEP